MPLVTHVYGYYQTHHPILEGKPLKQLPASEELFSRNEELAHGTSASPPEENKRNAVRNPLLKYIFYSGIMKTMVKIMGSILTSVSITGNRGLTVPKQEYNKS